MVSNYGSIYSTRPRDDSRDTSEFENNDYIERPEAKTIYRISFLQTFIPKIIVYVPVIGEIVRPIFFKCIENLTKKYPPCEENQNKRLQIKMILRNYKDANNGCGTVNATLMLLAGFTSILFAVIVAPVISLPVFLGSLVVGTILITLPFLTFKERMGQFERECEKDLNREFPNY
ncbi:MAG: hypothetical protein BGO10_01925 [Chlamydia sp. 32-24]|nr:MAG: hypothetical protein BGO10_01925 [Chlamydia sp. 32-24]